MFAETSCAIPVTLLSPLTAMKKGANALYIGVLHPVTPNPKFRAYSPEHL
jgi:hypothetical protein